jgi:hypothetical protein
MLRNLRQFSATCRLGRLVPRPRLTVTELSHSELWVKVPIMTSLLKRSFPVGTSSKFEMRSYTSTSTSVIRLRFMVLTCMWLVWFATFVLNENNL